MSSASKHQTSTFTELVRGRGQKNELKVCLFIIDIDIDNKFLLVLPKKDEYKLEQIYGPNTEKYAVWNSLGTKNKLFIAQETFSYLLHKKLSIHVPVLFSAHSCHINHMETSNDQAQEQIPNITTINMTYT